jgi:hypothetical protein
MSRASQPTGATELVAALFAAGAILAFAGSASAQPDQGASPPASFAGGWTTTEGDMSVTQQGADIAGTYSKRGGRVSGEAAGAQAVGYWYQDVSDQACDTQRSGTSYWGRFTWTLSADGSHFDGAYSYCGADPTYSWTGDRQN